MVVSAAPMREGNADMATYEGRSRSAVHLETEENEKP